MATGFPPRQSEMTTSKRAVRTYAGTRPQQEHASLTACGTAASTDGSAANFQAIGIHLIA